MSAVNTESKKTIKMSNLTNPFNNPSRFVLARKTLFWLAQLLHSSSTNVLYLFPMEFRGNPVPLLGALGLSPTSHSKPPKVLPAVEEHSGSSVSLDQFVLLY